MERLAFGRTVTGTRYSRRRFLAGGTLAGAGAAALLIACGSGSKGSAKAPTAGAGKAGLVFTPQDSTAAAKRGGVYRGYIANDPPSLDPLTSNAFQTTTNIAYYAYPRMLKWTTVRVPDYATGASEGDLAQSYEVSGDKLQVTFKLRPGLKWDDRTPTSGRVIDASDVAFSWQKFSTANSLSASMAYKESSPNAPIESVTATDPTTVVVKLKQPDASIIQLFTAATLFYVLPREADGAFDPRKDVRGHGPWLLTEYQPSARLTWTRNPNYYVKDRPFIDKIEQPVVSEYATQLAQFKSGAIYYSNDQIRQDDILPTKSDVPALLLRQLDAYPTEPPFISFGYEGDSPFKDQRVRQALAMLIDRETLADAISNRSELLKQGLDIAVRYHSVIGAGWQGYWLDPQDEKTFGPTAKYLKFNPQEAKRLLEAAGLKNGVDTSFFYSNGLQYGSEYPKVADALPGMFADGGIRARPQPKEYSSDWLPNYYYGYLSKEYAAGKAKGFNGFLYGLERGYPTVAAQMAATVHKDGERFHGLTPDGQNPHLGDPQVNALVEKMKTEFDLGRQQGLAHDLIKYMAERAYNVPASYARLNFTLDWPVIRNLGVYRTYNSPNPVVERYLSWWLDETQPPLKT
jgi:peptide/nickel transport system substrate-binding protein